MKSNREQSIEEKWVAQADESRYRDASDDSPAPFRLSGPSPYDEPYDLGSYGGTHGYIRVSPTLAVCRCGWHPWNHPGAVVAEHLRDFDVPEVGR